MKQPQNVFIKAQLSTTIIFYSIHSKQNNSRTVDEFPIFFVMSPSTAPILERSKVRFWFSCLTGYVYWDLYDTL